MKRGRSHQDYTFSGTLRLQRRRLLAELGGRSAILASGQARSSGAPSTYVFNADAGADRIVREYESRVAHIKLAAELDPAARLPRITCACCMVQAVIHVARTRDEPLFKGAAGDAGPVRALVGVLVAYLLTLDSPGLGESIIIPEHALELRRLANDMLAGREVELEILTDLLGRIAEAGGVSQAAMLPLD